jgi:hypothetical protein
VGGGRLGGCLDAHGGFVGVGAGERGVRVFGFAPAQLAASGRLGTGRLGTGVGCGGRGEVLGLDQRRCLFEPCEPVGRSRQLCGQFIDGEQPRLAVVGGIGGACLSEDLVDLAADPAGAAVLIECGVRADLGPIDRDRAHAEQSCGCAQPQHLYEDVADHLLMVDHEPGDGGMVGRAPHRRR